MTDTAKQAEPQLPVVDNPLWLARKFSQDFGIPVGTEDIPKFLNAVTVVFNDGVRHGISLAEKAFIEHQKKLATQAVTEGEPG